MPPLVSVIIAAYNAEAFISYTLDSILKQVYENIEVIVVNDGSTDNTMSVLMSFTDKRIKIVSQKNKGQDAAFNLGFLHSTGSCIKYMDSDDLINPEMISLQVAAINNSHKVAYSEWARFYDNKPEQANFSKLDYWHDADPISFLTARPEGVMLQCGSILTPRELIERAGGWDERLILFNDTEFFTRIFLASEGITFTPGAKLYYRSGMAGSISAQRTRKFFESTFLATQLIGERLLTAEDSYRVRNLLSNILQYRYYDMYPNFPDLGKKHEKMIAFYGHPSIKPDGGTVFKLLLKLMSWKKARIIQNFFYKIGYLKLIKTKGVKKKW